MSTQSPVKVPKQTQRQWETQISLSAKIPWLRTQEPLQPLRQDGAFSPLVSGSPFWNMGRKMWFSFVGWVPCPMLGPWVRLKCNVVQQVLSQAISPLAPAAIVCLTLLSEPGTSSSLQLQELWMLSLFIVAHLLFPHCCMAFLSFL